MDRSNKATLPLTVPRPYLSRLQRIHPREYLITIRRLTIKAFPQRLPNPPDLVHEQSSIPTQLTHAGHKSSFLARILT